MRTEGALAARIYAFFLPALLLPEQERVLFHRERLAHNITRVRFFVPLLVLMNVFTVVTVLRLPTMAGDRELWRKGVVAIHLGILPVALVLFLISLLPPNSKMDAGLFRRIRGASYSIVHAIRSVLGEVTALAALLGGTLLSINAQRLNGNMNAVMLGSLVSAMVIRWTAAWSIPGYLAAFVLLWVGLFQVQPDQSQRSAAVPIGMFVLAVGFLLSRVLYGASVREFRNRRTIEQQRRELQVLNTELERRVESQVHEIVLQFQEVEALNAQLQAHVRDRSQELSFALARLAKAQGFDQGLMEPGERLGDRVTIERVLGVGGMGVVYSARDLLTDRRVAVKVVQMASRLPIDAMQRFLREARAAASVNHPGVVRSLHVDITANGQLFQILEYVEGETLAQRIYREGPMATTHVTRLGSVLAEALASAHSAGIVHRDVKPANVMLTRQTPGVKLLDFGISRIVVSRVPRSLDPQAAAVNPTSLPDEIDQPLTRAGSIVGTPEYMAPEQVDETFGLPDPSDVSEGQPEDLVGASDIYALGLTLFYAATGTLPFDGKTAKEALAARLTSKPKRIEEVNPSIPAEFSALIQGCLALAPRGRPRAQALAEAFTILADSWGVPKFAVLETNRSEEHTLEATIPIRVSAKFTQLASGEFSQLASAGLAAAVVGSPE